MKITPDEISLNELKNRLKDKYPNLKDSDLLITNNNEKSMLTMVAYKLRKSKEEMRKIVEDL
ncbi:MAG: hypothetical protein ACP5E3_16895 [Bacteroidales bacterium]